ncbi:SusC/RagA family TonB-linked outer membrane protein [Pontibacter sp. G13]|uniref:SusC/RagA family TonB-linked outer membrane protein n=1 Tax=Pontibacter sp. G13 TaxID=3074898 RepID=UPI00288ACC76|nr:SusC/RagA family TonB-linked outer membrane protein [Pontibacter sp. G13]WNJ16840.1 SusC/RagA family TonB-linked outer membrane protein [Pontibacter sp. G13]
MKRFLWFLMAALFSTTSVWAQQVVSGKVTKSEDGVPIEGVAVVVKGTTIGMFTDIDGNYRLEVPAGENTLMYTFVGRKTVELTIDGRTTIDVALDEDQVMLDEVVVTALGVSKEKKSVGYAVQEVSGDDLVEANTVSVVDAMNGKVAGLNVINSSGAAGGSSRMVIRGQTSLNGNNEALVVVDGVRINNNESNTEDRIAGVALSNRVMDINPDDIESVNVLKGAAATALYGVDGARGVIVITTKKGSKNRPISVDFSTNITFSEPNKLPELQDRFIQGFDGIWDPPETGSSTSWGPLKDTVAWDGSDYEYDRNGRIVSQNDPTAARNFESYDNLGTFFKTGLSSQSNVSVSAGGDNTTFRLSAGYLNDDGIVPNNWFQRVNIGANGTIDLFDDRLHVSTNLNYVNTKANRIQQGSNISGLMLGLLRTPISFDNSNGLDDPVNNPDAYLFADGTQRNYRGGLGYDNPYWTTNLTPFRDQTNRTYGNIQATYDLTDWLSIIANVGADSWSDVRKQQYEINSRAFPAGQVIEDQFTFNQIDAYFTLGGNTDFNQSQFSLNYRAGVNIFNNSLLNLYVQGDQLNAPGFAELSNTASQLTERILTRNKTFAVFGSADIGWRNMLYLGLTYRQDWVSTLIDPTVDFNGSDISFGYPSVSVSWVFSELFDVETSAVTYGKLRASYARVGNGAPNPYLTSTVFRSAVGTINIADGWTNGISFPFNSTPGLTQDVTLGNPNLVPAFTEDFEVGLEMRFWQNRIGFDLALYTRQSLDEILPVPVARSTGYTQIVLNSGKLETQGLELIFDWDILRKRDWQWNMSVNFTTYQTEIKELADGVETQFLDGFTGTGIYNIPGEEYGQIFGGAWLRANTPDGTSWDPDLPYNPDGALIIDDDPDSPTFGFPQADPLPQIIGNPNPDWLMGINSSLTWKGLTLDVLFDIRQGSEMWNGTKGALTFFGMSDITEDRAALGDEPDFLFEGVKESNGDANDILVARTQDWYLGNGGGFGSVDEHFVEDASFYRLRLVSLAYRVPVSWLEKSPFKGMSITFTGRNLALITDYSGIDPETNLTGASSNAQGLEYFNMPSTRSYAVGIGLSF